MRLMIRSTGLIVVVVVVVVDYCYLLLLHSPSTCLTLFTRWYCVHGSRNSALRAGSNCSNFVVSSGF